MSGYSDGFTPKQLDGTLRDTFTMTLLTDTTGPDHVCAGDDFTAGGAGFVGATSLAVQKAVQALWAVNGFTGVTCAAGTVAFSYVLTFSGAAAAPIGLIAVTSLSSNATATCVETQVGVARQENLWSPIRGYPNTVTFFQGRLWFGGMQSQQESLVGSWVNDILNFETAQGLDDQAIYVTMSGVALNAITGLFPGKSLSANIYNPAASSDSTTTKARRSSADERASQSDAVRHGAHQARAMIDGNIILKCNGIWKSLRDFQFDYTVNQFNSLGISALTPNLIYNVNDIAVWNGSVEDEIQLAVRVTQRDQPFDRFRCNAERARWPCTTLARKWAYKPGADGGDPRVFHERRHGCAKHSDAGAARSSTARRC